MFIKKPNSGTPVREFREKRGLTKYQGHHGWLLSPLHTQSSPSWAGTTDRSTFSHPQRHPRADRSRHLDDSTRCVDDEIPKPFKHPHHVPWTLQRRRASRLLFSRHILDVIPHSHMGLDPSWRAVGVRLDAPHHPRRFPHFWTMFETSDLEFLTVITIFKSSGQTIDLLKSVPLSLICVSLQGHDRCRSREVIYLRVFRENALTLQRSLIAFAWYNTPSSAHRVSFVDLTSLTGKKAKTKRVDWGIHFLLQLQSQSLHDHGENANAHIVTTLTS